MVLGCWLRLGCAVCAAGRHHQGGSQLQAGHNHRRPQGHPQGPRHAGHPVGAPLSALRTAAWLVQVLAAQRSAAQAQAQAQAQHSTAQHSTAQHSTAQHRGRLQCSGSGPASGRCAFAGVVRQQCEPAFESRIWLVELGLVPLVCVLAGAAHHVTIPFILAAADPHTAHANRQPCNHSAITVCVHDVSSGMA